MLGRDRCRRASFQPVEVSNIILRAEDIDRSTRFWSDVVGLTVQARHPGFTFLDGGPIQIVLSAIESVTDESLTEVVFASEDVRSEYAAMAARGVPFELELRPVTSNDGKVLLAAHFRDPDGHYGTLSGWVDSE